MSTGIPANGPRTSAPSASTTTNTPDLLATLRDAESYATAALFLAEHSTAERENLASLIAAAERALAAARAALAAGGAA